MNAMDAIEVRICWGRTVLWVAHHCPPRPVVVGEASPGGTPCDFVVPRRVLGARSAPLLLVRNDEARAVLLPGATGVVRIAGHGPMSVRQAITNGRAAPCAELPGAHQIGLPRGSGVQLRLGDLNFELKSTRAVRKSTAALSLPRLANTALACMALSLLGHGGLMAVASAFFPPLGDSVEDAAVSEEQRHTIMHYLRAEALRELAPRQTELVEEIDHREGGTGLRAKSEEGSMGNPLGADTAKRYAIKGPKESRNAYVARQAALRDAAEFGLIGLLNAGAGGDPDAPTAPWGLNESRGTDPLSGRGNMWGNELGDTFGAAGLGLSGIGEGGGGRGEGLGMGSIGTIGHGSGTGTDQGFGGGNGGLGACGCGAGGLGRGFGRGRFSTVGHGGRCEQNDSPEHETVVPRIRWAQATVSGRLPPEVIQRIVRQNFGRFRACYQNGLRTNPSLAGRVVVRFLVGRDGRVTHASGAGDLPDPAVISCMTRAVYGLSFPPPDGGLVTVSYPLLLASS